MVQISSYIQNLTHVTYIVNDALHMIFAIFYIAYDIS